MKNPREKGHGRLERPSRYHRATPPAIEFSIDGRPGAGPPAAAAPGARYDSRVLPRQLGLFATGAPAIDPSLAGVRRIDLDHEAWIELLPGWVRGHDALFDALEASTRWRSERRVMYERRVEVPRLVAGLPGDGPGHPLLESMRQALSRHYREELVRVSMALYRDGKDSVAPHGDTVARDLPVSLMATVSLGAPRRFQLRPAAGGGAPTSSSSAAATSSSWAAPASAPGATASRRPRGRPDRASP